MEISYGLVNLMYFMLCSEHWRIKGSRSNKRRKLLTCFTNSLIKVYNNLSLRETGPKIYNITFLQPSVILPISGNTVQTYNSPAQTSQLDSQVTSLTAVNLPAHVTKPKNSPPPIQTVEPVIGFTPAEICRAEKEPKLTVKQLLGLSSCKWYIQMPLQTLDGMYVNQPS